MQHTPDKLLPAQRARLPPVPSAMAGGAQSYKICHFIVTEAAPRLQMMNLEILKGSAVLATPAISFHHLIPKQFVSLCVQLNPGFLLPKGH